MGKKYAISASILTEIADAIRDRYEITIPDNMRMSPRQMAAYILQLRQGSDKKVYCLDEIEVVNILMEMAFSVSPIDKIIDKVEIKLKEIDKQNPVDKIGVCSIKIIKNLSVRPSEIRDTISTMGKEIGFTFDNVYQGEYNKNYIIIDSDNNFVLKKEYTIYSNSSEIDFGYLQEAQIDTSNFSTITERTIEYVD